MNITKKTLSELSIEYYKEYATFIGTMRGSSSLSGLKPVHMRVLYALSTMKNNNHVKAIALLGETIGKYHPHADAGIDSAIVTLVKQGFLWKFGNWGSFNRTLEPRDHAAFRYISVGWTPFLNYVFENINYVEFIEAQIEPNVEPVTLPTPLPFALINGEPYNIATLFQGMSHGLSTIYPQFKFTELIDFVIRNIKSNWTGIRKYPEIFLGDNVTVTASIDAKEYWTTTKPFKISIAPVIEYNEKTREIWIKAITKKIFTTAFVSDLVKKTSVFTDLSTSVKTDIYMKFTRSNYFDEYLAKFKKQMVSTLRLNIVINVDDEFSNVTLYDWIKSVYELYKGSTILRLKDELKKLKQTKIELQIIDQLRPYIKEALQYDNATEKLLEITNADGIDSTIVKNIVSKYSIKKLLDIVISLDEIDSKINAVQTNLNNIDNYLIQKYTDMKKECSYLGTVFVAEE